MTIPIDRSYRVPYAAGYSADLSILYIDSTIPDSYICWAGELIEDAQLPLIAHELAEMKFLEGGLGFAAAHREAVWAEIEVLKGLKHPPDEYYLWIGTHVNRCLEDARAGRMAGLLPPDLSLIPYEADNLLPIISINRRPIS
jgi:hypothetical protein